MGTLEDLLCNPFLRAQQQQQQAGGIDPWLIYARQRAATASVPPPDVPDYERMSRRKKVKSRVLTPQEAVQAAADSVKDAQKLLPISNLEAK